MVDLLKIINQYKLKEKQFLLAVSGGVDSMVLLDLFIKAKLNFSVVTCNFNLRENTHLEVDLIKEFCKENKIEFHTKTFDTNAFMKANGIAVQEAARILRYNFFTQLKNQFQYNVLVTAHHLDDNIETFLINTIRGSGVKGLSSMKIFSDLIFRPLLTIQKKDLYNYAEINNVNYIEDQSNKSNKYLRNKIRNTILPSFENLERNYKEGWENSISNIQEANEYISFQLKCFIEHIRMESYLFINKLNISNIKIQDIFLLKQFLIDKGLNKTQLNDLINSIKSKEEKRFLTSDYSVILNRGVLLYFKNSDKFIYDEFMIENLEDLKKIPFVNKMLTGVFSGFNSKSIYINQETLKFPLKFCKINNNDVFNFLGTNNHQKINDFLSKKKISLIEKENTYVLKDISNHIVIVFPNFISEKNKMSNKKNNFLMLDLC